MNLITVHAGHNKDGKIGCGAIGYLKESTVARQIKNELKKQLKNNGYNVKDCTVDSAKSVTDNLQQIVKKCNKYNADLNISVHLNAYKKTKEDGRNKGIEVYYYTGNEKTSAIATTICQRVHTLGFSNRGSKPTTSLYVLRHTKKPTILIECFFCDDMDDIKLFNDVGKTIFVEKIVEAIKNFK